MTIEFTAYDSTTLETLTLPSCVIEEVTEEDSVVVFTARSRMSQYLHFEAQSLRSWNITIPAMTSEAMGSLQEFWRSRMGRVEPFKWLDPDTRKGIFVRFLMPKLAFRPLMKGLWAVNLEFQEAHPAEIENNEGEESPWHPDYVEGGSE